MASSSSSYCVFVVSLALVLQFLGAHAASALTLKSTKYIDKLCQMPSISDKPFCVQTLSAYPPAASATDLLPLATAVIRGILMAQAQKSARFAEGAAVKEPSLKKQFKTCKDAYVYIEYNLISAAKKLREDLQTANYDVMVCTDQTSRVTDLIGKNQDVASKTLIEMTSEMEKLITLGVAATEVLGA